MRKMRAGLAWWVIACCWFSSMAVAGCSDDKLEAVVKALGEGCLIDSDCEGDLVCVFRRCHVECETTKDCLAYDEETRCVLGDRPTNVCLLPDELFCGDADAEVVTSHADCLAGMYCGPDGECRDSCETSVDCLSGQSCVKGVCADDDELAEVPVLTSEEPQEDGETCSYNSHCRAPMVCRSGLCGEACQQSVDCPDGQTCVTVSVQGFDEDPHVCADPGGSLCDNGVADGDESDVDCGGSCAPCPDGGGCGAARDCQSGICLSAVCAEATCSDAVNNGGESGVDCGGDCAPCPRAEGCVYNSDCAAPLVCKAGLCGDACVSTVDCPANHTCEPTSTSMGTVNVCVEQPSGLPAHCSSAVQDGDETGTDCGGSCSPCADGGGCTLPTDCRSGVCDTGICAAPSCSDGVANGAETSVDCGGSTCAGCALDAGCIYNSDCLAPLACKTGSCTAECVVSNDCQGSEICLLVTVDVTAKACVPMGTVPASCSDSSLNGDETATDCGGSCPGCAATLACNVDGDCASSSCVGNVCAAASCSDSIHNGGESDVDCGNACPSGCALDAACIFSTDCAAPLTCIAGVCAEECQGDVDCAAGERCIAPSGVKSCALPLPNGSTCQSGPDCASGVCTAQLCVAPTCSDNVKNGTETNVDCGGSCTACTTGEICAVNGDCATGFCQSGVCAPVPCSDGMKNHDETAIDCGGSCAPCGTGGGCFQPSDCESLACVGNSCVAATCTDGLVNGDEGGIDCGGVACAPCGNGSTCNVNGDCASLSCDAGVCLPPGCVDGIHNGDELGTDCGSLACGVGCPAGTACGSDADCVAGTGCRPGASPICVAQRDLTIAAAGTGSGLVLSSNLDALSTGCASCTVKAFDGETVQLQAQPDGGSDFMGWSGGGCAGIGGCSVFMNGDITVTATFDAVLATVPNYQFAPGMSDFQHSAAQPPMAVGDGTIVIAGSWHNNTLSIGGGVLSPNQTDLFVARYDTSQPWDSGGHMWSRSDGGAGWQRIRAAGYDNGVIMVLGHTDTADPFIGGTTASCGANELFTVRFDVDTGDMIGSVQCLGGVGMTININDNKQVGASLWVVGEVIGTGTFAGLAHPNGASMLVMEIDIATGVVQQAKYFGNVGLYDYDGANGITPVNGGFVVAGYTSQQLDLGSGVVLSNPAGDNMGRDFVAFKIDTSITPLWGYKHGHVSNNEEGMAVATLDDDTVLLAALYEYQQDFGSGVPLPGVDGLDIALIHLDDVTGEVIGIPQTFGSTGNDYVYSGGLAVAAGGPAAGSIYMAMNQPGTLDWGMGPLPRGRTVVRWSSLGTLAWAVQPAYANYNDNAWLGMDALTHEPWFVDDINFNTNPADDWGLGAIHGLQVVRLQP